jgi:hypothetical protein
MCRQSMRLVVSRTPRRLVRSSLVHCESTRTNGAIDETLSILPLWMPIVVSNDASFGRSARFGAAEDSKFVQHG